MSYIVDIHRRLLGTARAAEALAVPELVYKTTGGYWAKADANDAARYPAVGVVTVGADVGAVAEVASEVEIGGFSGLTPGGAVYLSETAGDITQTAPVVAQAVGYAVDASTVRFEIRPAAMAGTAQEDITDNILPVKAGQSIQAAVTAASAVATSSSPCYVAYEPGVELTFTPEPYVYVVPAQGSSDYSDSVNGNQDIVDCPWHPVQVPYDMPLVAIVCDDAVATDETTDAASGFFAVPQGAPLGAGVTPFAYAVKLGIPISHAVYPSAITTPASTAGKYTYMTPAQLRWCQFFNGAEILSHSYTHQTQPTTQADMVKEIVGARDVLAALSATDYTAPTGHALLRTDETDTTPDDLGAAVRGFVMPGSWTDTKARLAFMRGALGRLIRATYQYSCDPNLTIAGVTSITDPPIRHGITRGTFALNAGGGIEANAANINTLGTRTMLMFHSYGATNNWTGWKAAIDILAGARDAGLIALVTPSTLVNAITVPQNAGHRSLWGGVPNGDFADGDVMWTKGGAATIAEGVATLPIDGSVYMGLPLKGGHSYTLRFNAKVTGSGTTVLRIYTDYHWVKAAAGTTNALYCAHARTLTNASDPGATAYDTAYPQYHTFYVPKWAQRVQITLRCYSGTAGDTIVVDNVGLALA